MRIVPRRAARAVVMLLALAATPARAHEGHDHGAEPAAALVAAPGRHTLEASSARHELVLKNDPLAPGRATRLDVFLSDWATNMPIPGAVIALSARPTGGGDEVWRATAEATADSGIYTASFTPPSAGSYDVVASLGSGAGEDVLLLSGLETASAAEAVRAAEGARRWWPWALGALALAALALLLRRGAPRARAAGVVLLALALLGAREGATHEGHDEAGTATTQLPVTAGSRVHMPKESQFLMRVRTELARREPMQERLAVLGRVAPRGGSELEITAPQTGRFWFAGNRPPVIGAAVRRGEPLGRLVVVDALPIRAALSGVVTGVFVANGQLVQAGQKLMTVLDPSVVWVHADVFESDLASVAHAATATVTSAAWPDQAVTARRVAIGATTGEVPGAVEAWYEAPNPGGRLRIGAVVEVAIARGPVDSAITVPRSALVEREGAALLFVHAGAETFEARPVEPGARLGDRVAVRGRLDPGERVVVTGAYTLLNSPVLAAP